MDVLSALCNTCHSNAPKYRCPRCSSRTCSLPCYKRHQTLATCSGIRDATAYVKKSALYTPAGVDHDFNFLTSMVSKISPAENSAVQTAGTTTAKWRRKRGDFFWTRAKDIGLTIHRAPLGLSREKENRSRYIGKLDDIIWTVEWLFEDGSRRLSQTMGSTRVESAYASLIARKSRGVKRRADALGDSGPTSESSPAFLGSSRESVSTYNESVRQTSGNLEAIESIERELLDQAETHNRLHISNESQRQDHAGKILTPEQPAEEADAESRIPFIYLLKPRTRGSRRVLIPVDVSQTVQDVLTNQEVVEYPAFQTLNSPPADLPDGYILLSEYLVEFEKSNDEMKDLVSSEAKMIEESTLTMNRAKQSESQPMPNCNDILATLKQDSTG